MNPETRFTYSAPVLAHLSQEIPHLNRQSAKMDERDTPSRRPRRPTTSTPSLPPNPDKGTIEALKRIWMHRLAARNQTTKEQLALPMEIPKSLDKGDEEAAADTKGDGAVLLEIALKTDGHGAYVLRPELWAYLDPKNYPYEAKADQERVQKEMERRASKLPPNPPSIDYSAQAATAAGPSKRRLPIQQPRDNAKKQKSSGKMGSVSTSRAQLSGARKLFPTNNAKLQQGQEHDLKGKSQARGDDTLDVETTIERITSLETEMKILKENLVTLKTQQDSITSSKSAIAERDQILEENHQTLSQNTEIIKRQGDTIRSYEESLRQKDETIRQSEATNVGYFLGRQAALTQANSDIQSLNQQLETLVNELNVTKRNLADYDADVKVLFNRRQSRI
ncbi:hypothetical protein BKA65DRAFT_572467 [Rhexocercosporidium sp. MPI-PUGE-AT-0058]|nr:hypothetical protein BKA65DRAFT_572467 [Rhexocercosporidium sp. MPI-PUGE-AT-0058]